MGPRLAGCPMCFTIVIIKLFSIMFSHFIRGSVIGLKNQIQEDRPIAISLN
jgi:hypothetical protein